MILDSKGIRAQTPFAEKNIEKWNVMEKPTSALYSEEMVYMPEVGYSGDGSAKVTIVNPIKKLYGMEINYKW